MQIITYNAAGCGSGKTTGTNRRTDVMGRIILAAQAGDSLIISGPGNAWQQNDMLPALRARGIDAFFVRGDDRSSKLLPASGGSGGSLASDLFQMARENNEQFIVMNQQFLEKVDISLDTRAKYGLIEDEESPPCGGFSIKTGPKAGWAVDLKKSLKIIGPVDGPYIRVGLPEGFTDFSLLQEASRDAAEMMQCKNVDIFISRKNYLHLDDPRPGRLDFFWRRAFHAEAGWISRHIVATDFPNTMQAAHLLDYGFGLDELKPYKGDKTPITIKRPASSHPVSLSKRFIDSPPGQDLLKDIEDALPDDEPVGVAQNKPPKGGELRVFCKRQVDIPPKSRGQNGFRHLEHVVYLSPLNPPNAFQSFLEASLDMDPAAIKRAITLHDMRQTIGRGCVRAGQHMTAWLLDSDAVGDAKAAYPNATISDFKVTRFDGSQKAPVESFQVSIQSADERGIVDFLNGNKPMNLPSQEMESRGGRPGGS